MNSKSISKILVMKTKIIFSWFWTWHEFKCFCTKVRKMRWLCLLNTLFSDYSYMTNVLCLKFANYSIYNRTSRMLHIIMWHYDFMLDHFANTFFRHSSSCQWCGHINIIIYVASSFHHPVHKRRRRWPRAIEFYFSFNICMCALAGIYNQT